MTARTHPVVLVGHTTVGPGGSRQLIGRVSEEAIRSGVEMEKRQQRRRKRTSIVPIHPVTFSATALTILGSRERYFRKQEPTKRFEMTRAGPGRERATKIGKSSRLAASLLLATLCARLRQTGDSRRDKDRSYDNSGRFTMSSRAK